MDPLCCCGLFLCKSESDEKPSADASMNRAVTKCVYLDVQSECQAHRSRWFVVNTRESNETEDPPRPMIK